MKTLRSLMAIVLMLCLALTLCACGGTPDATEPSQTENENPTESQDTTPADDVTTPVDDGKVLYTITVVDTDGNPIVGAMVQMCKDTCYPNVTDANGVAQFSLVEDEYKVSFLSLPEGYAYQDTEEFYFAEGATELTITLKAAE